MEKTSSKNPRSDGHAENHVSGISDWRSRHKTLIRYIAVVLVFTFLLYDVTWAQGGTPLWEHTRPADVKRAEPDQLRDIKIPYHAGQAQESFSKGGKEVIINIQDAHASLSAQHSIVDMLDMLASTYNMNVVAIEGADAGPVDVTFLRSFPDTQTRRETAEYLMRKGRMSAGEFFAVTNEKQVKLYGIEQEALYQENIEAFRRVTEKRLACVAETDKLIASLSALEPKIYSDRLLKLNTNLDQHREGKSSFKDHWALISDLARDMRIAIKPSENLSKLLRTMDLEKDIDFARANQERTALIHELSEKLPKAALEDLTLKSIGFKTGKISQSDFHQYLVTTAEKAGVMPAAYANLIKFSVYTSIYEGIDVVALFEEIDKVDSTVREALYRNEDERKLYDLARMARIIKRLFEVSSDNADIGFVTGKKDLLDRAVFCDFIKNKYQAYGLAFGDACDLDTVFGNMPEAIEFYNIAQNRNSAMLANTIRAMKNNGEHVAALVTGGFHSRGLGELMREKGLSYLVVMPKFQENKERPYITILTNKKQPYEELIDSGAYTLAVPNYFRTGDARRFFEAVDVGLARETRKGKDAVDVLADWLVRFTRDFYAYKAFIDAWDPALPRPITPEELAGIFGFDTPRVAYDGQGNVADIKVSLPQDKPVKYTVENITVDGQDVSIIAYPSRSGAKVEVSVTHDKDGIASVGEVTGAMKEVLARTAKKNAARPAAGEAKTAATHEDAIKFLSDASERAIIVDLAVKRILDRKLFELTQEEIFEYFVKAANSQGINLSGKSFRDNQYAAFKELVAGEINAKLAASKTRQETVIPATPAKEAPKTPPQPEAVKPEKPVAKAPEKTGAEETPKKTTGEEAPDFGTNLISTLLIVVPFARFFLSLTRQNAAETAGHYAAGFITDLSFVLGIPCLLIPFMLWFLSMFRDRKTGEMTVYSAISTAIVPGIVRAKAGLRHESRMFLNLLSAPLRRLVRTPVKVEPKPGTDLADIFSPAKPGVYMIDDINGMLDHATDSAEVEALRYVRVVRNVNNKDYYYNYLIPFNTLISCLSRESGLTIEETKSFLIEQGIIAGSYATTISTYKVRIEQGLRELEGKAALVIQEAASIQAKPGFVNPSVPGRSQKFGVAQNEARARESSSARKTAEKKITELFTGAAQALAKQSREKKQLELLERITVQYDEAFENNPNASLSDRVVKLCAFLTMSLAGSLDTDTNEIDIGQILAAAKKKIIDKMNLKTPAERASTDEEFDMILRGYLFNENGIKMLKEKAFHYMDSREGPALKVLLNRTVLLRARPYDRIKLWQRVDKARIDELTQTLIDTSVEKMRIQVLAGMRVRLEKPIAEILESIIEFGVAQTRLDNLVDALIEDIEISCPGLYAASAKKFPETLAAQAADLKYRSGISRPLTALAGSILMGIILNSSAKLAAEPVIHGHEPAPAPAAQAIVNSTLQTTAPSVSPAPTAAPSVVPVTAAPVTQAPAIAPVTAQSLALEMEALAKTSVNAYGVWGQGWGRYIADRTALLKKMPAQISREERLLIINAWSKVKAQEKPLQEAVKNVYRLRLEKFVAETKEVSSLGAYERMRSRFVYNLCVFLGYRVYVDENYTLELLPDGDMKDEYEYITGRLVIADKNAWLAIELDIGRGVPGHFTGQPHYIDRNGTLNKYIGDEAMYKHVSAPLTQILPQLRNVMGGSVGAYMQQLLLQADLERIDRIHDAWMLDVMYPRPAQALPSIPYQSSGLNSSNLGTYAWLNMKRSLYTDPQSQAGIDRHMEKVREEMGRPQPLAQPGGLWAGSSVPFPQGFGAVERARARGKMLTMQGYYNGQAASDAHSLFGAVDAILTIAFPYKDPATKEPYKDLKDILRNENPGRLRNTIEQVARRMQIILNGIEKIGSNTADATIADEFTKCPVNYIDPVKKKPVNRRAWWLFSCLGESVVPLTNPNDRQPISSGIRGLRFVKCSTDLTRPIEVIVKHWVKDDEYEWYGSVVFWNAEVKKWQAELRVPGSVKGTFQTEVITLDSTSSTPWLSPVPGEVLPRPGHTFVYDKARKQALREIVRVAPDTYEIKYFMKSDDYGQLLYQETTAIIEDKEVMIQTSRWSYNRDANGYIRKNADDPPVIKYFIPEDAWQLAKDVDLYENTEEGKAQAAKDFRNEWNFWDKKILEKQRQIEEAKKTMPRIVPAQPAPAPATRQPLSVGHPILGFFSRILMGAAPKTVPGLKPSELIAPATLSEITLVDRNNQMQMNSLFAALQNAALSEDDNIKSRVSAGVTGTNGTREWKALVELLGTGKKLILSIAQRPSTTASRSGLENHLSDNSGKVDANLRLIVGLIQDGMTEDNKPAYAAVIFDRETGKLVLISARGDMTDPLIDLTTFTMQGLTNRIEKILSQMRTFKKATYLQSARPLSAAEPIAPVQQRQSMPSTAVGVSPAGPAQQTGPGIPVPTPSPLPLPTTVRPQARPLVFGPDEKMPPMDPRIKPALIAGTDANIVRESVVRPIAESKTGLPHFIVEQGKIFICAFASDPADNPDRAKLNIPTRMFVTNDDMTIVNDKGERYHVWTAYSINITPAGEGQWSVDPERFQNFSSLPKIEERVRLHVNAEHRVIPHRTDGRMIAKLGMSDDGTYVYRIYESNDNVPSTRQGRASKAYALDPITPRYDIKRETIFLKNGKVTVAPGYKAEKILAEYWRNDADKRIIKKDYGTGEIMIFDLGVYIRTGKWLLLQKQGADKKITIYQYDNLDDPTLRWAHEENSNVIHLYKLGFDSDGNIDAKKTEYIGKRCAVPLSAGHIALPNAGRAYSHIVSGGDRIYEKFADTDDVPKDIRGQAYRMDKKTPWRTEAIMDQAMVIVDVQIGILNGRPVITPSLAISGPEDNAIIEQHKYEGDKLEDRLIKVIERRSNIVKEITYAFPEDKRNKRALEIKQGENDGGDNLKEGTVRVITYNTQVPQLLTDKSQIKIGPLATVTETDGQVSKRCYYRVNADKGKNEALVVSYNPKERDSIKKTILTLAGILIGRAAPAEEAGMEIRPTTVLVPLTDDGLNVDTDRLFKIYDGDIHSFAQAARAKPITEFSARDVAAQGATSLIEQAWDVMGSLGGVIPEALINNFEKGIYDLIKKSLVGDKETGYLRFILETRTGVSIDPCKVLEKEIWSEMFNLTRSYLDAKAKGKVDILLFKRWANIIKSRLEAFEEISFNEYFIKKKMAKEHCRNIRYVYDSMLAMIQAVGLEDAYTIFNHHYTRTPVIDGTWTGSIDETRAPLMIKEIPLATNGLAEIDLATGKKYVDMSNREIMILLSSLVNGKTKLKITCNDINGATCTFTAIITGNNSLNMLSPDLRARLFHRIHFAPTTQDARYTISRAPTFDPTRVISIVLDHDADLNMLDVDINIETLEKAPQPKGEVKAVTITPADGELTAKAMGQLMVSDKWEREEEAERKGGETRTFGELYFDLTEGEKPVDLTNTTFDITEQLPAGHRKAGVKVMVGFYNLSGEMCSAEAITDENGIYHVTITPAKTTDFDPATCVARVVRFEMGEKSGILWLGLLTTLISAIGAWLIHRLLFYYKWIRQGGLRTTNHETEAIEKTIDEARTKPLAGHLIGPDAEPLPHVHKVTAMTPAQTARAAALAQAAAAKAAAAKSAGSPAGAARAVAGPPAVGAAPAYSDEQLLNDLKDGIKGINDWVDNIGVDFRMQGSQEEDKGIFFPRLRKSEPWEFYDQAVVPRYNVSIIARAVKCVIACTALYFGVPFLGDFSFAGTPGLINIFPYILLAVLSGGFNWYKVAKAAFISSGFLTLQFVIPSFCPGIPLHSVSFALSIIVIAFDLANLFVRYYQAIAHPRDYIVAQKRELKKLHDTLLVIRGKASLIAKIRDLQRFKRSRDLPEWEDQQYTGGAVVKVEEPFITTLDAAIDEVNAMLSVAPDYAEVDLMKLKWFSLLGTMSLSVFAGIAILFKVGVLGITAGTAAALLAAVVTGAALAVAIVKIGRKSRDLTLMYPAVDMKNIYRDYQKLIYNAETGKNMRAIDVRRYLVEIRAAASRVMQNRVNVTTDELQESLDSVEESLVNVKDTATVRDFMDTFHLTKLENLWKKLDMGARVGALLAACSAVSYVGLISVVVIFRQMVALMSGEMLLNYGQLFEHTFGIVEMAKEAWAFAPSLFAVGSFKFIFIVWAALYITGTLFSFFTRDTQDQSIRSLRHKVARVQRAAGILMILSLANAFLVTSAFNNPYLIRMFGWLPRTALQSFFGGSMLASLMLFASKFPFYNLGKYAKLYPGHEVVKREHFVFSVSAMALSGLGLAVMTVYGIHSLGLSLGYWPGLIARVALLGILLYSAWKTAVLYKAKDRFKAICVDDKLYDGREDNDLTTIENQRRTILNPAREVIISYDKYNETILGKYTPQDYDLIVKAGDLKHAFETHVKTTAALTTLFAGLSQEDFGNMKAVLRRMPGVTVDETVTLARAKVTPALVSPAAPVLVRQALLTIWIGRWKDGLSHAERLKYESLFGKGGEPSGALYTGLETVDGLTNPADVIAKFLPAEMNGLTAFLGRKGYTLARAPIGVLKHYLMRRILERVYEQLDISALLERMSGKGFSEIKKKFHLSKNLSLWTAQADPSLLGAITADQIRSYIDEHSLNEKKIIVTYDLLPKFTPWIVVVLGADAIFKLLNALLSFRYPLNRLKFIFAGENWDMEVQDAVRTNQKTGKYPPQLVFRGMPVREDGRALPKGGIEPSQAYTKPGANTSVLNESDGVNGIIYDAENIPAVNQIIQLVLGTMDGVTAVRHLTSTRFDTELRTRLAINAADTSDTVIRKTRQAVDDTVTAYLNGLRGNTNKDRSDLELHYRYNFKLGGTLRKQMAYFVNHSFETLGEITNGLDRSSNNLSTAMILNEINKYVGLTEPGKVKKRRELINLYITLCNMPEYGINATEYIKGGISKQEFIKRLIIGEFRRINEPKNGQGRLAKINTALHRSPGQVSAFMYGEYASWYTAGWDGFMAAQDTFKPLGGTTGYFCTEPVEDIDWKDPEVMRRLNLNRDIRIKIEGREVRTTPAQLIERHYRTKNKLLTLGAWDEFQVAEDYMLGYLTWLYGFNIAAFYSLTPEDPAGLESGLSFKFRPKQMSRWNKGYIIGLLVISEDGNFKDLLERKGWWGTFVFLVPTLCSAVHPIMFRIARLLTIFWWYHFLFIPLQAIGGALVSSPTLGPIAIFINNMTGAGTFLTSLHTGIDIAIPQILNFLPVGWAWGIGPAIVLVPIFIHRFYTIIGILRGVNDYLGQRRILQEYDEWIEDLIGSSDKKIIGDPRDKIGTLYADIDALNEPRLLRLVKAISFSVERHVENINGNEYQTERSKETIETLRGEIISSGKPNINILIGKLNALDELIDRRETIRRGALTEMQGIISPRRFSFAIAIFMGAFIGILLSLAGNLPFATMMPSLLPFIGPYILGLFPSLLTGIPMTLSNSFAMLTVAAMIIIIWKQQRDVPMTPATRITATGILAAAVITALFWPAQTVIMLAALILWNRPQGSPVTMGQKISGGAVLAAMFVIATLWQPFAPCVAIAGFWTLIIYGGIMYAGITYIENADTSVERSVRAIRVRTMPVNFFIDFYHILYLSGNQIAWGEAKNGGRIGYWWRTPRPVGILKEVIDRHAPAAKIDVPAQRFFWRNPATGEKAIEIMGGDLGNRVFIEADGTRIYSITGGRIASGTAKFMKGGEVVSVKLRNNASFLVSVNHDGNVIVTPDRWRDRVTSFWDFNRFSSGIDRGAWEPAQVVTKTSKRMTTKTIRIMERTRLHGRLFNLNVTVTRAPGRNTRPNEWRIVRKGIDISAGRVASYTINASARNTTAELKIDNGPAVTLSLDPDGNINITNESMKGEPKTLEESLEEPRLGLQLIRNYGFMVIMFFFAGIGLAIDMANRVLGEDMMFEFHRISVHTLISAQYLYNMGITALIVFAIIGSIAIYCKLLHEFCRA